MPELTCGLIYFRGLHVGVKPYIIVKKGVDLFDLFVVHALIFFYVALTTDVVVCLQVIHLMFKLLLLVESLPENEVSLHGHKLSFITPYGGEKNIISVFVVWLYKLLQEEFLLLALPCSPI